MKLSTRGDYGVRVVLELARAGRGAQLPAAELADRCKVPQKYLGHLLLDLKAHGIVKSMRGPQGGFSLGRPASEITVGEVVRVMDGPLAPIQCASRTAFARCPQDRCQSEETCVLRGLWLEVRDAISAIVDTVSFADLAARPGTPAAPRATYAI